MVRLVRFSHEGRVRVGAELGINGDIVGECLQRLPELLFVLLRSNRLVADAFIFFISLSR